MADPLPTPQQVFLRALTPAPWNPRTISDERFQNLCRSLEADPDFLHLRPILATQDGTIFAGNMRYRAAQQLGWDTVPAILVDIPEQLARERALRDNAQWGEWEEGGLETLLQRLGQEGSDLGLLGFEDRELRDLLNRLGQQGGLTDPDAVPDLPDEPITRPGDLWLLGGHRVLCGDATDPHDVAIVMAGEKAKLMATDPPYLVNYVGGNHPPSAANKPGPRTSPGRVTSTGTTTKTLRAPSAFTPPSCKRRSRTWKSARRSTSGTRTRASRLWPKRGARAACSPTR